MARIGSKPIQLNDKVTVSVDKANRVTVQGPKGELIEQIDPDMTVSVEDDAVVVDRPTNQKRHRALHGLSRSLIDNMVEGVTNGYKKRLVLIGVGYRAEVDNDGVLELALGYSHPIFFMPPEEVSISIGDAKSVSVSGAKDNVTTVVEVEGIDKQLVGQVAAKIRSLRPPEVYKGKGVRYDGEHVSLKAGKTAAR
ncbi:50S ribosomal protein L6 [Salisaeta longa]|uniref:50S ribosomal protein L6 n=1 Tax=Salisaeta longa TaxID=503170 RepID=UPI0003B4B656|nr:50S ribosomal protein L6 [Salisaeta longa]